MANAAKRWAVGKLSAVVSNYVEGITEQNVQASLNMEVGQVEMQHVRVHKGLLEDKQLQLLSSDIGMLSAVIPWRTLGVDPTVITVRDVWVEVRAAAPPSAATADPEDALRSWRSRRQQRVQAKVEARQAAAAAAAEEATTQKRSIAARMGHACIKQLRVRIENLRIRIHHERPDAPPLDVYCARLALDEGSSLAAGGLQLVGGVADVPASIRSHPASLDKVLCLNELSAQLIQPPPRDGSAGGSAAQKEAPTHAELEDLRSRLSKHQREMETKAGGAGTVDSLRRVKERLQVAVGTPLPVIGPLSIDARVWHAAQDGLLWVGLALKVGDTGAVLSLSRMVARSLCEGLEWYRASLEAPLRLRKLLEEANGAASAPQATEKDYLELFGKFKRREIADRTALDAMEDLLPEDRLVDWQMRHAEQASMPKSPRQAVERAPSRVIGWLRNRFATTSGAAEASGSDSSEEEEAALGGEDEASSGREEGDGGFDDLVAEELDEPRRIDVRCAIPQATILAVHDEGLDGLCHNGSVLKLQGGVDFEVQGALKSGESMAQIFQAAAWEADVIANLSCIAVRLDNAPLILLQQDEGEPGRCPSPPPLLQQRTSTSSMDYEDFEDCCEDEQELEASQAVGISGDGARRRGHAARLKVNLARRTGAPPLNIWALTVRLKQEPLRFLLSPRPVRRAIDMSIAVVRAFALALVREELQTAVLEALPADEALGAQEPDGASSTAAGSDSGAAGSDKALETLLLDLDLDVAAPVLRWSLHPACHTAVQLGRLLIRTCSKSESAEPSVELRPPEQCAWRVFACCCHLTETSAAVVEDDNHRSIYEPSTIRLRAWREHAGAAHGKSPDSQDAAFSWQLRVDSQAVRWTIDPGALRAIAQLPSSLDFALGPLREVLADVSGAAPPTAAGSADDATAGPSSSSAEAPPCGSGRSSDVAVLAASETRATSKAVAAAADSAARICVKVSLQRFEVLCSLSETPSRLRFVTEGIAGDCVANARRVQIESQVRTMELTYEDEPVFGCHNDSCLSLLSEDQLVTINGTSALFEVQWHEQRVREVVVAARHACECVADGRRKAQELLAVSEENQGMSAELWSKYVSKPLRESVQHRAATRLAALCPGYDTQAELPGRQVSLSCSSIGTDGCADAEDGGAAEQMIPAPRGEASIKANFAYTGLRVTFLAAQEALSDETPPSMQVTVTGADCTFQGFRSGDASAVVSLATAELDWRGRRLLTPRRADDKLLQLELVRPSGLQPMVHWKAAWAQVCVLFRQRDYDHISEFVSNSIVGPLSSPAGSSEPPSEPPPTPSSATAPAAADSAGVGTKSSVGRADENGHSATEAATRARFVLDIGAPLVYMPTDRSTLMREGRSDAAGSRIDQLVEDYIKQEPMFMPAAGDGYMVFDFGHVRVLPSVPGELQFMLRGAHILGACPSESEERRLVLRDLLCPSSVNAVLRFGGGPIEFHMKSVLHNDLTDGSEDAVPVDHRLSLTRSEITLFLDVLAENICYAGRSAGAATMPPLKALQRRRPSPPPDDWLLRQQAAFAASSMSSTSSTAKASQGEAEKPGRGFSFSWSWPHKLVWDISFTEAAPVVQLCLRGGSFSIDSRPDKSTYGLRCAQIFAEDMRKQSRNKNKILLDVAEAPAAGPGFQFEMRLPSQGDSVASVRVLQPVVHVLPQLLMDVMTVGTSAWSHCSFRRDGAAAQQQRLLERGGESLQMEPQPSDGKTSSGCTRIEIGLLNGSFRVVEKWAKPDDYFEFAGSLRIDLRIHAAGLAIEHLDLEGGALRLRNSRQQMPTTLCPCLEWSIRGEQKRTDDDQRMKRLTELNFSSVVVQPYSVRVTVQDHRALMEAASNLVVLDADTAEPASELRSRDPFAVEVTETRFNVSVEAALLGVEIQILGEEGGRAWPGLQASARCGLFSASVHTIPGTIPTINLHSKKLELELSAYNHRLGSLEPVLPLCSWEFMYHMQQKPDAGRMDAMKHFKFDAHQDTPVSLIITSNLVHLTNRVLKTGTGEISYEHLLGGVNISGRRCLIDVENNSAAQTIPLEASSELQPLDALLKSGGARGSQAEQPFLRLRLDGDGGEPCRMQLGREANLSWQTESAGLLLVRLITPRPPQFLLVISSTVCIRNLTSTDLEVRFLAVDRRLADGKNIAYDVVAASDVPRCINAACLSTDVAAGGASKDDCILDKLGIKKNGIRSHVSEGGALRLPAGEMLSAPAEAQLRTGQVILQLRPHADAMGGIEYDWSDYFFSVAAGHADEHGVTICSKPLSMPGDLPPFTWHIRTCKGDEDEIWCTVDIQAPFTIVNACPFDTYCLLNPRVKRQAVGKPSRMGLKDTRGQLDLTILNGRGGQVRVTAGGCTEVFPLRLDGDRCFHFILNGEKQEIRCTVAHMNCVVVLHDRQRNTLEWQFFSVQLDSKQDHTSAVRLGRQSSLPVFDRVSDDLTVSFGLKDLSGKMTAWSLPVQGLLSGRSAEETIDMSHNRTRVRLNVFRRKRELLLYAPWWFVNSTDMQVDLYQRIGNEVEAVSRFGREEEAITLLPSDRDENGDGIVRLRLPNQALVTALVPDRGGSQPVDLTRLHPFCLRTETVALSNVMDCVSCCVVTLLPSLLLFNKTALWIGFRLLRRDGTATATNRNITWVPPGESSTLTGEERGNRAISVAVRESGHPGATPSEWSDLFVLTEARIGAYPVCLKHGKNVRFLVRDAGSCHQLINKHKAVMLDATMQHDGKDETYLFSVPPGEQCAFAGKGAAETRLKLTVASVEDPSARAAVVVHLNRIGLFSVPLWIPASRKASNTPGGGNEHQRQSTLQTPSLVQVSLVDRVAVVTVTPGRGHTEASAGTVRSSVTMMFGVQNLKIALLTEGSVPSAIVSTEEKERLAARRRAEAFTISLSKLNVNVEQTQDGRREMEFSINSLQVDLQRPRPHVLFRNATQPFLKTKISQDDVAMLDVHVRMLNVVFGEMEVDFTNDAWEQMRILRRNLRPGIDGLMFDDVLMRGSMPYHLLNDLEPPAASPKIKLAKMQAGVVKLGVWCKIYLPEANYVPKSLRETIQMVNFATNTLNVKGANVEVPPLTLFAHAPAEGSLGVIVGKVCGHYTPHIKACWRSLLQNSNVMFFGLFSRATWMPREREQTKPKPLVCAVGARGELLVKEVKRSGSVLGAPQPPARQGARPSRTSTGGGRLSDARRSSFGSASSFGLQSLEAFLGDHLSGIYPR
eukprot:TRINITY_DN13642_c0_g1_i2.p1 TRINITY_DN13642_c0_g1~~TRINITY_DN13642_c0_g1_i2.p1  ORF type:complete len:3217 (+),score=751.76 TRINITY_DN13642_c0_g1_i2:171-9821(+)